MTPPQWFRNDVCSVARTLEVMGERWTVMVMREAFLGTRRFDAFLRNTGAARNILSDRLSKLVEHGIMERRLYNERPPRYEYRLTKKGVDLYPAIVALMRWGDTYLPTEMGPAVLLEHTPCGHMGTPVLFCEHCREPIDPRDMRAHPGPAAENVVNA
jgi:DNA-binding HxlR family transcriptional regulator